MLSIGWSELMVIAVVAVIIAGPKDIPEMLRSFGRFVGQMRKIADSFHRQLDEVVKESELGDVRTQIQDLQKMQPKKILQDLLDPDGEAGRSKIPKKELAQASSRLDQITVSPQNEPPQVKKAEEKFDNKSKSGGVDLLDASQKRPLAMSQPVDVTTTGGGNIDGG